VTTYPMPPAGHDDEDEQLRAEELAGLAPDGKAYEPYDTWFHNDYTAGTDHGRCGPGFAEKAAALPGIDAQPYRGTWLSVLGVAGQGIAVVYDTFTGLAGGSWAMLGSPVAARAWGHYVLANWLLEHSRGVTSHPFRSWKSPLGYWAVEHDGGRDRWHVVTGAAPGLTLQYLQTAEGDRRAGWEFVEQTLRASGVNAGCWPQAMLDARLHDLPE